MQFTLGSLIGIALATLFFGYFFGLFEGRAQGYRKRKKEEPLERQPIAAVAQAAPESPGSAAAMQPAAASAWLRLYTDSDGKPGLDLDGKRVDTSRLTPGEHQRLIQLMVVMRPWVEPGIQAASPDAAPGAPQADGRTAEAGVKLPQGIAGPSTAGTPPDPGTPLSMVAQIDSILQARLQGTPLGSRRIRLAESLDGGVLVFVGQQSYPGISEVPDPEVQAAIRAAISDWEKRYTPG